MLNNPASVTGLAFSRRGDLIAAGGSDIRLWSDYPAASYLRDLCKAFTPSQAERLWRQAEPSIAYRRPC